MKKKLLFLFPLAFLCLGCADPNYERAYASSDFVSFFETLTRIGKEGKLKSPTLSLYWADLQTGSSCKDFRCFYSNQDFSSISELAKTIEVAETTSTSLPDIEGVETRVTIFLIFQDFLDTYTLFFHVGNPLCTLAVGAGSADGSKSSVSRYFDWGNASSIFISAFLSLEYRCHSADYPEDVVLPFSKGGEVT